MLKKTQKKFRVRKTQNKICVKKTQKKFVLKKTQKKFRVRKTQNKIRVKKTQKKFVLKNNPPSSFVFFPKLLKKISFKSILNFRRFFRFFLHRKFSILKCFRSVFLIKNTNFLINLLL